MRRREFIAGLGSAATWPVAARAQQAAVPVIGYLGTTSPKAQARRLGLFRRGLSETGYIEGKNVATEYRWGGGQRDRYRPLAEDLVGRKVDLIVASGGALGAIAAKAATSTIPIVFAIGGDPVRVGLVASLRRPGGNLTGITNFAAQMETKQFGLLRELVPKAKTIGMLMDPFAADTERQIISMQPVARALGVELAVARASTEHEIGMGFTMLVEQRIDALYIGPGPSLGSHATQIIALADRYKVPVIYTIRGAVDAGGLVSHSANTDEEERQLGIYAGRILKGEKPADLPVIQPTKFELVINLKTAKALGLTIPETLLATADEVIQ
jgi:putative tryptophan/tyrosine transport system substrate-binding protein